MALPRQIDLNMREVQNLMNLKSASVNRQVNYVFDKMTYYGQSRHHAKNEARTLGAKTSNDVSKLTGIYGIRTRASYQKYCAEFLRYCRNPKNFDMENDKALKPERNILNLTDEHVRQFLVARSKTVSRASMGTVGSALNKFEAGLRRIDGLNRSWRSIIQDVKTQCQKKEYSQRGYERPLDIVNNLSGEYRVLAELQLFNGLRIGEMYKFSMANLVGNSLHLTNTKGGKARLTIELPPDTKRELVKLINNGRDGVYKPDLRTYQHELRKAVRTSTQRFTGSHGLRYNYAQHRMYLLQENSLSYNDARLVVSKELGHNRPGIVEVYLRR